MIVTPEGAVQLADRLPEPFPVLTLSPSSCVLLVTAWPVRAGALFPARSAMGFVPGTV